MPFEYQHFMTADGSPTLATAPNWERMHAEEGAFTERQLIYQPLVENAFDTIKSPVFLSLGLGIGYNEFTIAFEALKCSQKPELIASYESVDFLKECFIQWLKNKSSELAGVYDQITEIYSRKYDRSAEEAKNFLLSMLNENRFRLLGRLEDCDPPVSHAILYDAFSPKTCPQLWESAFLDNFFKKASAPVCYVATHACNTALKQALKKNGFTLDIQEGFGRKRESMSAYKLAEFKK